MGNILSGLVVVNGTDIWTEYGVFLVEDRRGGMENLTAILTPMKPCGYEYLSHMQYSFHILRQGYRYNLHS